MVLPVFNTVLRPDFFICWFTNPPTAIFRKLDKKKIFQKLFFLFYPQTLNIICLVEKKYIFEVLSVHF